RKGRILDVLTNSLQLLRQRLDPQSQELLTKLNIVHTQRSNLVYNRPPYLFGQEYRHQYDSLTQQVQKLEADISHRSQEFRTAKQKVTIEEIQNLLPANSALVELVEYQPYNPKDGSFGVRRYAAYILPQQGQPTGIDLGEVQQLESALQLFRLSLRDRETPISQLKQAGRQLDEILMKPVRRLLGSTGTLLISPDGELNLIPFEALVDENERYLVESYRFTYLTSGRDLIRFSEPSGSQQSALVLGNPDFERKSLIQEIAQGSTDASTRSINLSEWGFSQLPGTEEEVKAIAQLLGVEPLLASEATEEVVKRVNRPNVLHVATHGFFETAPSSTELTTLTENPMLLSGLVLAGFKEKNPVGEDGVLTASELASVDLYNTQLVVLSACDTGRGKITSGEGIYGLRRALVIAGSQSQLISLRKVDDTATKELMVNYYQKLKQNQGRSQALRQTQLEMLESEKYHHPYYWASFIASGNWQPMVFNTHSH
ncbi:MAG: CHAT domain-containing protein, partial [Symploca sp. SIO1C4]|nr:CHAT domain-containing protein [Symploca sp. SIO1C4]